MVGSDPGPVSRLSIGRVLEALRPEFPDVTISKIRFLEAEGLIRPDRTPSGYRMFSESDVERLRFVLSAQRDRFWPLRVIREALDARDRGLDVEGSPSRTRVPEVAADPDVAAAAELLAPERELRLTGAELATSAGVDVATVDALVTYGLLAPDSDGHFDARALRIARAAAGLFAYGLEPRHLRPFRTAADREIGLLRQITGPARRRSEEEGRVVAAELLHHCLALHTALVKGEL